MARSTDDDEGCPQVVRCSRRGCRRPETGHSVPPLCEHHEEVAAEGYARNH